MTPTTATYPAIAPVSENTANEAETIHPAVKLWRMAAFLDGEEGMDKLQWFGRLTQSDPGRRHYDCAYPGSPNQNDKLWAKMSPDLKRFSAEQEFIGDTGMSWDEASPPDKPRSFGTAVAFPAIAPDSGVRETAWTPGPWTARPRRRDPQQWSIDADKGDPTLGHKRWDGLAVYGCDDMPKEGAAVAKANARLIAAAPDLFAALNSMIEGFTTLALFAGWSRAHIAEATAEPRAAIARATQQRADDAGRSGGDA